MPQVTNTKHYAMLVKHIMYCSANSNRIIVIIHLCQRCHVTCHAYNTRCHEHWLWNIAALLRLPRLSRPRLEAVKQRATCCPTILPTVARPCARSGALGPRRVAAHPAGVCEQKTLLLGEPLPCNAAAETATQSLIWRVFQLNFSRVFFSAGNGLSYNIIA